MIHPYIVAICATDPYVNDRQPAIPAFQRKSKVEIISLAAIPVEVGGGYKFIFTEREAGSVYVYKEKTGAAYTEGSFTVSLGEESRLFHLRFDDTVHTYVEYRQPFSRATLSPLVVVAFYEDLTEKFKPEYPEAESVCSFQYFYQR